MAKRKVIRKSNKPLNIFDGGGKMSGFEEFINSDTFQGIQKGISTFNLGASSSQGQPNFLSMNQSKGSGLMGSIGSAVDTTGQLLSGIDTLLTKKRKPLAQTVGLISSDGRRLYAGGGGLGAGDYMNMGTTALALAGNAVQQAQIEDTSDLKEQVKQYGNVQVKSDNFDDLMNDWASRTELQHISAKDLRNKSLFGDFANSLSASGQGFAAGSAAGPIGAAVGGIVGGVSSVIGSIIGRNKAKKEAKRVNKQIDIANARNLQAYEDKAQNIDAQNDFGTMASFAAFGGPLGIWGGYGSGAIGYELAKENLGIKALNAANKGKLTSLPNSFESSELNTFAKGGKIHIKPENRGKFTALKKRTGKSATWFKEHGTPAQKKMATFALNARKWKHEDGGPLNPYSAGALVDAIYSTFKREKYLGKPSHNYDFTISEEEADKLGYYPDERGHRDDRVKKPTHPTHPSRGKWKSFEEFELTDRGMENPNYTLFGLNDGGQDPQAVMTYNGGIVLPEITVTPKGSYIMNPYDNIKIFDKGGSLTNKKSSSRRFNNNYKEGEIYDVTEEEVKLLKELGYEFEYV